MELTTMERMKLVELLPTQENILTLKIVRKLRETLSYSEEELKLMEVRYEYVCPFSGEVDGKPVRCDNKGFFPIAPKCAEHDVLMVPTGQMTMELTPELQTKTKEIHMGPQAMAIASDVLKRADEAKRLTDAHISLYEKFFPPIPEAIEKSMEE